MFLSDLLPASIAWQPDAGDLVLLGALEQDLPIVETVLATLPTRARGQVFVEVESAEGIRDLAAPGRVCVTWLLRDHGQSLRSAVDAWLGEMLAPKAKGIVVPARQAYSHSASVGSRTGLPEWPASHLQKFSASAWLTQVTGWSSVCRKPGKNHPLLASCNHRSPFHQ